MPADREFQFTYRFDGSDWGIKIFAADAAEAKEKIKAVALARYDGEVYATIPVLPSSRYAALGWTAGILAVVLVISLAVGRM